MNDATNEKIIRNLKDRVAELEHQIDAIRAQFSQFELEGVKLTNSERMLMKILHDANGRPVGRGHLYDALYALKPEADWADDKIIDVFVCKIRRKLQGTEWFIRTEYCVGYSLHRRGAGDA